MYLLDLDPLLKSVKVIEVESFMFAPSVFFCRHWSSFLRFIRSHATKIGV